MRNLGGTHDQLQREFDCGVVLNVYISVDGWAWLETYSLFMNLSSSCQYTTRCHEVYPTSSTLSPASGER